MFLVSTLDSPLIIGVVDLVLFPNDHDLSTRQYYAALLFFTLLLIIAAIDGDSTIKWVRTAQNTKDKLTPQPELKFNHGGGYQSDSSIKIDR